MMVVTFQNEVLWVIVLASALNPVGGALGKQISYMGGGVD